MPSIRLSAVAVLVLATVPFAGCAYHGPVDVSRPTGTEAVVSHAAAGGITARANGPASQDPARFADAPDSNTGRDRRRPRIPWRP